MATFWIVTGNPPSPFVLQTLPQIFIYYPIENNEPSFPLITTNTLTLLWPGLIYGLLTRSLGSFLSQLLLNICCVIFADVTVLCAIKKPTLRFL